MSRSEEGSQGRSELLFSSRSSSERSGDPLLPPQRRLFVGAMISNLDVRNLYFQNTFEEDGISCFEQVIKVDACDSNAGQLWLVSDGGGMMRGQFHSGPCAASYFVLVLVRLHLVRLFLISPKND